uniref:Ultrabithorax n=1 Tax=Vespula pensylvanica TaxID=30213 RepID=A0A834P6W6_VESPE|nr:hypothetical protein H0235_006034 [Vespula pensylvanica]
MPIIWKVGAHRCWSFGRLDESAELAVPEQEEEEDEEVEEDEDEDEEEEVVVVVVVLVVEEEVEEEGRRARKTRRSCTGALLVAAAARRTPGEEERSGGARLRQSPGGFYGSHHHQTGAASQHHDPATAAYRSFPLGLGMSPYASSQHHHHTSGTLGIHPGGGSNTRPPQDSPYDASVATACKLYSTTPEATGHTTSSYSTTASKDCKQQDQTSAHQNGYAAAMAVAAVKDVWQSATSATNGQTNSVVRPSACTPEGTRVGTYGGLVGGDPASSPGNNGTSRSLASTWNTCSLNSSASQPVATQLHQQPSNHTFYPWMAIAGTLWNNFERADATPSKNVPIVGGIVGMRKSN